MPAPKRQDKDPTSIVIAVVLHVVLVGGIAYWAYRTGKLEQLRQAVLQYVRAEKKPDKPEARPQPARPTTPTPNLPPINTGRAPGAIGTGTRRAVSSDAPDATGDTFFQDTRKQVQGPSSPGGGGGAPKPKPPPPRPVIPPAALRAPPPSTIRQLLQERSQAAAVTESFGTEQIARSAVTDVGDIVSKVSGASVVEGKFAVIRGLGDRYNLTLLNGAELPTADPYRRAAQLDLIPSFIIDRLVISKTFTPDLPGGFAGGVANIITKSFPDRFTMSLTVMTEYNTQATGNDGFLTYSGGGTDWTGFDDGTRSLPSALKDVKGTDLVTPPRVTTETPVTSKARREQANRVQSYLNSFESQQYGPVTKAPPPNYGGSLSIGDTVFAGERRLGYLANLHYSQKYQFYDDGYTSKYRNAALDAKPYEEYRDARSLSEVNWSSVIAVGYEFNEDNLLGFSFLYNRSGEDLARHQVGSRPENLGDLIVDRSSLHWIERDLLNYQIKGDHTVMPNVGMKVSWLLSISSTSQLEPDQRFFNYARDPSGAGNVINDNALPEPSVPTRNFRDLTENSLVFRFDDTLPLRVWNGLEGALKAGTMYGLSERSFFQKSFAFEKGTPTDPWELQGDPNTYFTPSNLLYSTSVTTRGATNYTFPRRFQTSQFGDYEYEGRQEIPAGYFSAELPVTSWLKAIGGVRVEGTDLTLDSTSNRGNSGTALSRLDVLPGVGLIVALSSNQNLRVSYSQTLARPTYREIAPYESYDPFGDEIVRGNPNLTLTDIVNYDVRWEWFPTAGALVSLSAFYKDLKNPIEKTIVTFGGGIVSFENRPEAKLYGMEVELRHRMDVLDARFSDLSAGVNFSYIRSDVPLSRTEAINDPAAENPRQLYDQSEWLFNADITWENRHFGSSVSLQYNAAAPRIYLVDRGGPDVFEHPPTLVDVVYSQRLSRHMKLRFSAKNLLNSDYRRTYGPDFDGKIYSTNTRGITLGLTVGYEY